MSSERFNGSFNLYSFSLNVGAAASSLWLLCGFLLACLHDVTWYLDVSCYNRSLLSFVYNLCVSIYLSVCLSICVSMFQCICLSIFFVSIFLRVYLSVCLSICVSIYLCVNLSKYVFICVSIYLCVYLSLCVFLCACLSIYFSIYLSFPFLSSSAPSFLF